MKKFKEFLLFLTVFVAITAIRFPWRFLINSSDTVSFISGRNYLKLLLNDELYMRASISNFLNSLAFALVGSAIFVAVMFFIRNKFRFRRAIYYILCAASGMVSCFGIATVVSYASVHTEPYYSGHMLTMSISEMFIQSILNSALQRLFVSLQTAVLCALVVWFIELIASKIKPVKEKTNEN